MKQRKFHDEIRKGKENKSVLAKLSDMLALNRLIEALADMKYPSKTKSFSSHDETSPEPHIFELDCSLI
jgi:hypothetical protein